ncbi:MAG: septum formation inhibitor Maf [Halanaerobiales bacterium]|nr:septum formation inhibitor Maf [Halanaerobiales bacterium]
MKKLILASASPRRRDLLKQIELDFEIIPSTVEENISESDPIKLVGDLALLKASDVAQKVAQKVTTKEKFLVLGADTLVVDGQTVLGKPSSKEEAFQMLKRLSGRNHQVMTGIAVVDSETEQHWVDVEITQVYFRELTDSEIERYVESGEPMDKAGAYAIQEKGALFVKKIDGCFFNVVGLPILRTIEMLNQGGIGLF